MTDHLKNYVWQYVLVTPTLAGGKMGDIRRFLGLLISELCWI